MGMTFDPPQCPECGADPQGTSETIPGCAQFEKQEDGSYEYSGYTEPFWDGQMTDTDDVFEDGRVKLICKGDGAHDWFATKIEG